MSPPLGRTKLERDDVFAILRRLREIYDRNNPNSDSITKIAADYSVEAKTITRIKIGQTWAHVKAEFEATSEDGIRVLGINGLIAEMGMSVPVKKVSVDYADPSDVIEWTHRVREIFVFEEEAPLVFGSYDWIDGVHSVASDGIILWDDQSLANFVVQLRSTEINDAPVFAAKIRELPTSRLFSMMTQPVNHRFSSCEKLNDFVRIKTENGLALALGLRYHPIIEKHGFDVYQAGTRKDFVYLTKNDKHGEPVIYACLATLKEKTHAK